MDSVVNNLFSSWDSMTKESPESKKKHNHWHKHRRSGSSNSVAQGDSNSSKSLLPDIFANTAGTSQLTDKFVERLISMALPPSSDSADAYEGIMERVEMQKTRPQLSVPLMSKNFIQLNSRLSIPFELIDEVIRLVSWTQPSYTLSILLIASHIVLRPILVLSVPFFYVAFNIMVPAYLKRHPPEKTQFKNNPVPAYGPAVHDIETPKPVPELSREFYLNLTDLQNHMLLYVLAYDFINYIVVNFCYFKDEPVSSFIYLVLTGVGVFTMTFITDLSPVATLLKLGTLTLLWGFFIALHSSNRNTLLAFVYSEDTRIKLLTITNKLEQRISQEFDYVEEKEVREIEIFELQTLDPETKNWQLVCYSSEIYAPNSVKRQNKIPLNGALSLRNIKPPVDWQFLPVIQTSPSHQDLASSPTESTFSEDAPEDVGSLQTRGWTLDLNPQEWVSANNLSDLLEIDDDEKWCYDVVVPYPQYKGMGIGGTTGKKRGDFRRRRWIRTCVRAFNVELEAQDRRQHANISIHSESDDDDIDDNEPDHS